MAAPSTRSSGAQSCLCHRCSKLAGTSDASSSRSLLRSSLAAHPLLSFGTRLDNLKGLLFGFALLNVDSSIRVDSVTLWQRLRATDDRAASSPRGALIWLVSGRATGGTAERRADGGSARFAQEKRAVGVGSDAGRVARTLRAVISLLTVTFAPGVAETSGPSRCGTALCSPFD